MVVAAAVRTRPKVAPLRARFDGIAGIGGSQLESVNIGLCMLDKSPGIGESLRMDVGASIRGSLKLRTPAFRTSWGGREAIGIPGPHLSPGHVLE